MKYILCVIFFASVVHARVEVAFIEKKDSQGNVIEFEQGARFSHVAVSYHGRWLHTHPYRGIEVVDSAALAEMGEVSEVVSVADRDEPSDEFVRSILGRPYEHQFSWVSENFYCSKLVAKILDLHAEPMNFNAPIWPEYFHKYNGQPGLSPQGVYRQLAVNRCENIFK